MSHRAAGVSGAIQAMVEIQVETGGGHAGWACTSGLPRGDVIADAGYGAEERFRAGITELGLRYIVGVKSTNAVWAGIEAGIGAADMRLSVEKLALALSDDTWRTISWREGTNEVVLKFEQAPLFFRLRGYGARAYRAAAIRKITFHQGG